MNRALLLTLLLSIAVATTSGCAKPHVIYDTSPARIAEFQKACTKGLTISRGANSYLTQKYFPKEGRTAFAVSGDGKLYETAICNNGANCQTTALALNTLHRCQKISIEGDCQLLYVRDTPICAYESVDETLGVDVVPAEGTTPLGPEKAEGAILYVPGYGGWVWPPDQGDDNIPYILERMGKKKNFDIFKVNTPFYNVTSLLDDDIVDTMANIAREYVEKGYKKIVFAGQSRGGWAILQGSIKYSADNIYYIPSAAGYHGRKGKPNRLDQADDDLRELLTKSQARNVLLFFYRNDPYRTDAAPGIAAKIAATKPNWHVIDKPEQLSGHSSLWKKMFRRTFYNPISEYIDGKPFEWSPLEPRKGNFKDLATAEQVTNGRMNKLSRDELNATIQETGFYFGSDLSEDSLWMDFKPNGKVHIFLGEHNLRGNEYDTQWRITEDGHLSIDFIHRGDFDDYRNIIPFTESFGVYLYEGHKYVLVSDDDKSTRSVYLGKRDQRRQADPSELVKAAKE